MSAPKGWEKTASDEQVHTGGGVYIRVVIYYNAADDEETVGHQMGFIYEDQNYTESRELARRIAVDFMRDNPDPIVPPDPSFDEFKDALDFTALDDPSLQGRFS